MMVGIPIRTGGAGCVYLELQNCRGIAQRAAREIAKNYCRAESANGLP